MDNDDDKESVDAAFSDIFDDEAATTDIVGRSNVEEFCFLLLYKKRLVST